MLLKLKDLSFPILKLNSTFECRSHLTYGHPEYSGGPGVWQGRFEPSRVSELLGVKAFLTLHPYDAHHVYNPNECTEGKGFRGRCIVAEIFMNQSS